MGEEYSAKVFRSGNSVAIRMPKSLGLKEGDVMRFREERGRLIADLPHRNEKIDLSGIYGSVPGVKRPPCGENPREWSHRQ